MKKDFTQPFEQSDQVQASLLIKIVDGNDSRFVLTEYSSELTDEYMLPSVMIEVSDDPVLPIARFLYEHGMLLTNLRKIIEDRSVDFSFIDDTPGRIETLVCYYAQAEIIVKIDKLSYIPAEDYMNRVERSSFTDDAERAAARLLTAMATSNAQQGNKGN